MDHRPPPFDTMATTLFALFGSLLLLLAALWWVFRP
jgi:hypothetical protein